MLILHIASELREAVPAQINDAAHTIASMDGMGAPTGRMECRAVMLWSQKVPQLVVNSVVNSEALQTVSLETVELLAHTLSSIPGLSYVSMPSGVGPV